MFAGKLPKLPFELSDAKTFLGMCVFKTRKKADGTKENYDFRLRINIRIDLPEEEIEDTLIHEMIHYYIGVNQLQDTSAHGQMFQHFMNSINEKYGRHITISHKSTEEEREQLIDKKEHYRTVAVVKQHDGKVGIKVLPRVIETVVNYYNKVLASRKVKEIDLYMSKNPYFNRYPNSGALNVHYVDEEELKEKLKDAKQLSCDGKTLLGVNEHKKKPTNNQTPFHVIAVVFFKDGRKGFKVLPRVLPRITTYYNSFTADKNVDHVELYMHNHPYFHQFPNSGTLNVHIVDEDFMQNLVGAEKMECDGKNVKRGK